jgi:hypothetical protein
MNNQRITMKNTENQNLYILARRRLSIHVNINIVNNIENIGKPHFNCVIKNNPAKEGW